MKKKLWIVALVIVTVFVLYNVLFNMTPGSIQSIDKITYDPNGFVDAMELSNINALVAENDDFALYLNETNSHFKIIDKASGKTWYSNPVGPDPWQFDSSKTITKSAIDKQKSTLELTYFNETGSLATINNYELSIAHPESVLYDRGFRTYSIKYVDNGFQVLYDMKDIDIDYLYFPKYLKPAILEAHPQSAKLRGLAYTHYDPDLDMYVINDYEGLSVLVRRELYPIFYGEGSLEYTREQAIAENAEYGYTEITESTRFQVALQVLLTATGVKVSVIQDSIGESIDDRVASIALYPHFGTAISRVGGQPSEGYIVLPDGSGAVINFNNGKFYQQPYSKRLYGDDLGIMSHRMPEVQQPITIPMYGMVKEDIGFAAIITEGDAMATINADVSGRIDSYNKVYPSFKFRETEAITLGTGFNQYAIDLWTDQRVDTDFSIEYHFLSGDDASYVGMAEVYRQHLETVYGFDHTDTTTSTQLTVELLGAYQSKDFLLGVPYYRNQSLTTFEQSQEVLDALLARDIDQIDVLYKGMINDGLSASIANQFDLENSLGSKRDYQRLLDYASAHEMTIYPNLRLLAANGFDKMFDQYRYASSRIDGKLSKYFAYHLPSKLPYSEAPTVIEYQDDYVINPLYLEEIMADFQKRYDGETLAFDFLGGILGGHYDDQTLYKQHSMLVQRDILASLPQQTMLSNPLGFAMSYADQITDLPLETTRYAILDYQIPLLQLILSGKVDYSSISLNLANERTVQYYFLKTIETGSNLKYTLSYDSSTELKETEFNYYFSTEYTNWLDQIETQVKALDELGIHESALVGHEWIATNVFKVSYDNGLEILINYNLSAVTDVLGYDIPAMDYIVMGV